MFGVFYIMFIIIFPISKCTVPGRFFWKPRLAIDLNRYRQVYPKAAAYNFTRENVESGHVVIIDGYNVGLSALALASKIFDESHEKQFPHLTPYTAHYFTNMYRWAARYLSLIPYWMASRSGTFPMTHKVWKRRFHYMSSMIPDWMKALLPFISEEEWIREYIEYRKYKAYAEPVFGKHYVYPIKDVLENLKNEKPGPLPSSSSGI